MAKIKWHIHKFMSPFQVLDNQVTGHHTNYQWLIQQGQLTLPFFHQTVMCSCTSVFNPASVCNNSHFSSMPLQVFEPLKIVACLPNKPEHVNTQIKPLKKNTPTCHLPSTKCWTPINTKWGWAHKAARGSMGPHGATTNQSYLSQLGQTLSLNQKPEQLLVMWSNPTNPTHCPWFWLLAFTETWCPLFSYKFKCPTKSWASDYWRKR